MNNWTQETGTACAPYDDMKALQVRNRNIVPNLLAQKSELTARIAKIDTLLALFEKNSDFVQFFDLARELV